MISVSDFVAEFWVNMIMYQDGWAVCSCTTSMAYLASVVWCGEDFQLRLQDVGGAVPTNPVPAVPVAAGRHLHEHFYRNVALPECHSAGVICVSMLFFVQATLNFDTQFCKS